MERFKIVFILAMLLHCVVARSNNTNLINEQNTERFELKPGAIAPDLNINNWLSGKYKSLKDVGNNPVVIVFIANFVPIFDTTCNYLIHLQGKYSPSNVVFFVIFNHVSVEKIDVVKRMFSAKINVGIDDSNAFRQLYKVSDKSSIFSFILNAKKQIVWYGVQFSELEDALVKTLNNKMDVEKLRISFELKQLADEYFALAVNENNQTSMKEMGEKILKNGADDPLFLNEFAWNIMTNERIKHRDNILALKAAKRACDIVKGTEPAMLDTYARALFANGQIKDAIHIQRLAIELTTDKNVKEKLSDTLKFYESQLKQ